LVGPARHICQPCTLQLKKVGNKAYIDTRLVRQRDQYSVRTSAVDTTWWNNLQGQIVTRWESFWCWPYWVCAWVTPWKHRNSGATRAAILTLVLWAEWTLMASFRMQDFQLWQEVQMSRKTGKEEGVVVVDPVSTPRPSTFLLHPTFNSVSFPVLSETETRSLSSYLALEVNPNLVPKEISSRRQNRDSTVHRSEEDSSRGRLPRTTRRTTTRHRPIGYNR